MRCDYSPLFEIYEEGSARKGVNFIICYINEKKIDFFANLTELVLIYALTNQIRKETLNSNKYKQK